MPKIVRTYSNGVFGSLASNGSQPTIFTAAQNADGTPVKDPDQKPGK